MDAFFNEFKNRMDPVKDATVYPPVLTISMLRTAVLFDNSPGEESANTIKATDLYRKYLYPEVASLYSTMQAEYVYSELDEISTIVYGSLYDAFQARLQGLCLSDPRHPMVGDFVRIGKAKKMEDVPYCLIHDKCTEARKALAATEQGYAVKENERYFREFRQVIINKDAVLRAAVYEYCSTGVPRLGERIAYEHLVDVLSSIVLRLEAPHPNEGKDRYKSTTDDFKLFAAISREAAQVAIVSSPNAKERKTLLINRDYESTLSQAVREQQEQDYCKSVQKRGILRESLLMHSLKRGPLSLLVRTLCASKNMRKPGAAETEQLVVGSSSAITAMSKTLQLIDGSRIEVVADDRCSRPYSDVSQELIVVWKPSKMMPSALGEMDYAELVLKMYRQRVPATIISMFSQTIYQIAIREVYDEYKLQKSTDPQETSTLKYIATVIEKYTSVYRKMISRGQSPKDVRNNIMKGSQIDDQNIPQNEKSDLKERIQNKIDQVINSFSDFGKKPLSITFGEPIPGVKQYLLNHGGSALTSSGLVLPSFTDFPEITERRCDVLCEAPSLVDYGTSEYATALQHVMPHFQVEQTWSHKVPRYVAPRSSEIAYASQSVSRLVSEAVGMSIERSDSVGSNASSVDLQAVVSASCR